MGNISREIEPEEKNQKTIVEILKSNVREIKHISVRAEKRISELEDGNVKRNFPNGNAKRSLSLPLLPPFLLL